MSLMDLSNMGGGAPGGPPAGGPPPSIPVDGPPQGDPAGGGTTPEDLVKKAMELIDQAKHLEPDDQDTAALAKIEGLMTDYIGNQSKLLDSATGAGPGAKLVRKAQGGSTPAGGGGY